ncbi:helix-turn-helix transcriptional regulator [Bacillota bacterium Meth-B3]
MVNTNKLLGRMVELGMTQKKLAKAIDCHQSTLSLKINNARPMNLDEANCIAKHLEIPDSEYGAYFFADGIAQRNRYGRNASSDQTA